MLGLVDDRADAMGTDINAVIRQCGLCEPVLVILKIYVARSLTTWDGVVTVY